MFVHSGDILQMLAEITPGESQTMPIVYVDIPRYYTAIAEWLSCIMFCLCYHRKTKTQMFVAIAAGTLAALTIWLSLTGNGPVLLWVPCMAVAIGIMYLFLDLVIDAPARMVSYYCMKAFLAAEFMAALEWQIEYYIYGNNGTRGPFRFCVMAIVYGLVLLVLYRVERSTQRDGLELHISIRELMSTLLIVSCAFTLGNFSFVYRNSPFSGTMVSDIYMMRTLVDFAGIAILCAYQSLLLESRAANEMSRIQSMLTAQYDSYRNYQEVTDLINMKYHDLKHQIAGLRAEQDADKRAEWINQLERELGAYQPERQTGNQVLDGVIDGKMPVIRRNQIQFTCVADGSLLRVLHVMDLCTIFGNALDNAIEHVLLVPDPDHRIIHMEVSQRRQFIYIEVRNYCDQDVRIKNGFPVTTKRDVKNHGFGVKSISYTVKKYGGNVQFDVKDHFFSIRILIPQT